MCLFQSVALASHLVGLIMNPPPQCVITWLDQFVDGSDDPVCNSLQPARPAMAIQTIIQPQADDYINLVPR
jgi:hypothetical protein